VLLSRFSPQQIINLRSSCIQCYHFCNETLDSIKENKKKP
jgi:hypothetical protein